MGRENTITQYSTHSLQYYAYTQPKPQLFKYWRINARKYLHISPHSQDYHEKSPLQFQLWWLIDTETIIQMNAGVIAPINFSTDGNNQRCVYNFLIWNQNEAITANVMIKFGHKKGYLRVGSWWSIRCTMRRWMKARRMKRGRENGGKLTALVDDDDTRS